MEILEVKSTTIEKNFHWRNTIVASYREEKIIFEF